MKERVRIEYPLKVVKYGKQHIDYLIAAQAEESIHIEFKAGEALGGTDHQKAEISKDVSAFANADGGIIIYGLSEWDHKASAYAFVDGRRYSKEWLEQVINSKIKRRIPDLTIDVIRVANKISQSIYVVKIPKSYESPHMASDGRYYKRYNFESVRMDEYEVRDLFHRTTETNLKILPVESNGKVQMEVEGKVSTFRLQIVVDIQNVSRSIETVYKGIVKIPRNVYDNSFERQEMKRFFKKYEKDYAVLSIPGVNPLFPKEISTLANFYLNITRRSLPECQAHSLKIRLYYSNGVYQSEVKLPALIHVAGRRLSEEDFM